MSTHPELRAKWKKADYPDGMGSAAVVAPPTDGSLRVYHMMSAEYAISAIGLCRLKVARFSDLNDPFELLSLSFKEKPARKWARGFKDSFDSHTGLVCFSRNWTNPVLWSHYASKHKGICLGFDLIRSLAEDVTYVDKRLLATVDDPPAAIDKDLQKKLLCTKFQHWHYEQEVRCFIPLKHATKEGNLHFFPLIDPLLRLSEVILGPECQLSLAAVRRLTSALHPGAVTFGSRLAFKFFNVVPFEPSVP